MGVPPEIDEQVGCEKLELGTTWEGDEVSASLDQFIGCVCGQMFDFYILFFNGKPGNKVG